MKGGAYDYSTKYSSKSRREEPTIILQNIRQKVAGRSLRLFYKIFVKKTQGGAYDYSTKYLSKRRRGEPTIILQNICQKDAGGTLR
jgi:hypothetical protein